MSSSIDENTKVPAGVVIRWIALSIAAAASYVMLLLRVDRIGEDVKEIKVELRRSWSVADMRAFVRMSELMNPSLNLPDVEKVDDPR